jgi:hypothetical protein
MKNIFSASLCLAMVAPWSAWADTRDDIQALREEMQATRAAYEARLQALEQKLQAAQSSQVPAAAPPVTGTNASGASQTNAMNPALSLILSGLYTNTSQDPTSYNITGFRLPKNAEVGPGQRSFSLAESELGFSANIDPWWRGQAHVALHPDNSVSVEEAYIQTTAWGRGLSLKAGRFLSGIGYLNTKHAHTWDFVEPALNYQAMLGNQYAQDGVQLTWLAPSDQFIELGLELGRGHHFPGGGLGANGAGSVVLSAHTGGDVGISHNWRAGLSLLHTKAQDQERSNPQDPSLSSTFTGKARVAVLDALWKWAPNGNTTHTQVKLQGEYMRSMHRGTLTDGATSEPDYKTSVSGWYVVGVYQFLPRWRVGLRTEKLHGESAYSPSKHSLMLDYSTSEFARLRLQVAQDRARQHQHDQQIFLQYQMSLGAHGAHGY